MAIIDMLKIFYYVVLFSIEIEVFKYGVRVGQGEYQA